MPCLRATSRPAWVPATMEARERSAKVPHVPRLADRTSSHHYPTLVSLDPQQPRRVYVTPRSM